MSVVRVDFAMRWDKPVHVGKGDLLDQAILGPADAIRYIELHFDARERSRYGNAIRLCREAVKGNASLPLSRQAFLIAFASFSVSIASAEYS